MPAQPASATAASNRNKPIEIIMACESSRISIGDGRYWARTSDPSLSSLSELAQPGGNPHPYAKQAPLEPARNRLSRVTTGAQLARSAPSLV
jgi:hypothetical protein